MKDRLKQFCYWHVCKTYVNSPRSPPICAAAVEKWRLLNRKRFVFSSLQRQNLLLLCHERSGGHVNTHNVRIWSLENLHEVLELQRDSLKLNVFCAISGRKVYGPFVFGEPIATGSVYLDVLQLWLFLN
ncbi:uncharacterized protein TNCV_4497961 [Trichonephila clavipes]|nr:uncharacterized protein TNCV_4497961 [Trichonephila clavipes]